jgi:Cof subfamily protein (haloacid dehalogenase superfamily)
MYFSMPNFPYKTFVFDLDGTLLNGNNELTSALRDKLAQLKMQGYKLVIATGRTFGEVQELVKKGEFHAYICSNAMTIHNEQFQRIKHLTLPEAVLEHLIQAAAEQQIYYELRQNVGPGLVYDKHYPDMVNLLNGAQGNTVTNHEWHARKQIVQTLQSLQQKDLKKAVKVYFFHPDAEKMLAWREELVQLIAESPISIESSSINSCEIVHEQASKGLGLQQLVALGFTKQEEILCFGDSFNDVSMFQYAAYSVAMKNANDALKQIADENTAYTNDENGVLHWLVEHMKE